MGHSKPNNILVLAPDLTGQCRLVSKKMLINEH